MQVDWKSAGCPLFDKPPAPAIPTDLHAALASSLVGSVLGAEGLERLAAAKRQPLPQQQPHAPGVCVCVCVYMRECVRVCARAHACSCARLWGHTCVRGRGKGGEGGGLGLCMPLKVFQINVFFCMRILGCVPVHVLMCIRMRAGACLNCVGVVVCMDLTVCELACACVCASCGHTRRRTCAGWSAKFYSTLKALLLAQHSMTACPIPRPTGALL